MAEYLPPMVVSFEAKTEEFEARLLAAEKRLSSVGKTAGEQEGPFSGLEKALGTLGVAFGAYEVVDFGKRLVEAGEKAEVSDKRIENISKSMGLFGEASGEVSERLIKLAENQSLATGVDVNAIKTTEAKLLTFKELAKTAGEAGGEFDRATQAAQDMAAAGFGSAEQNAVQLGKALNDPVKGITALARSGITFTAQEKEQIKTMVEHNHMLDAQKVVLKAIETQVGGTAAATATSSAKMNAAFTHFQETLGKQLVPAVDALAAALVPLLNWVGDNIAPIGIFVGTLTALAVAFNATAIATAIQTSAVWAFTAALLANPVTWIVLAIAALAVGIYELVVHWKDATKWISDVWNGFVGWLSDSFKAIGQWWGDLWKGIGSFIKDWWPVLLGILTGGISVAIGLIIKNWGAISGFFQTLWKDVAKFFVDGWNGIIGFLSGINKTIYDIGSNIVLGIWNGIKNAWGNLTTWVQGLFNGFIDGIKKLLGIHSPSTVFHGFGSNLMQGLINGIDSMSGAVGDSVAGVANLVTGGFNANITAPALTAAVSGSMPTGGALSSSGYSAGGNSVSSTSNAVQINTTVNASTNASPAAIAQATVNAIKFNAPIATVV